MEARGVNNNSDSPWVADAARNLWLPYTQMKTAPAPLPVVATHGTRIMLADGRTLIDGVASWWTAAHGYNHPHIRDGIAAQLERMPHVMLGGLVHEPAARLATRLAAKLPGDLDHVFFSESGSVAVEIAMKIAVQFWRNHGRDGRTRFLSFLGGYHGDTFATMSVCDPDEGMHRLFKGAMVEQPVVPLPTDDASFAAFSDFLTRHAKRIAAVLIEPLVQGAGGMRMHSPEILGRIAGAARAADTLVICDEIFTGFGRTGTMFACEQAGIVPDILTLSKALTGGTLPLAATVAQAHVFEAFLSDDPAAALMHGPTYCGNALGCAAANASLDLFETEPRLAQVAAIERQLAEELAPARALPGVADVRVKGAVGAIALDHDPDVHWLRAAFVERGVFLRPFGRTIYTTPAFIIPPAELSQLSEVMLAVTKSWDEERRRRTAHE
jgi:adenosylmethionine-8-amino-7-oxononanoate aminotransferase